MRTRQRNRWARPESYVNRRQAPPNSRPMTIADVLTASAAMLALIALVFASIVLLYTGGSGWPVR